MRCDSSIEVPWFWLMGVQFLWHHSFNRFPSSWKAFASCLLGLISWFCIRLHWWLYWWRHHSPAVQAAALCSKASHYTRAISLFFFPKDLTNTPVLLPFHIKFRIICIYKKVCNFKRNYIKFVYQTRKNHINIERRRDRKEDMSVDSLPK